MRVVLDTNIVVSGLLREQGNPARVLALALAGEFQVCQSQYILAEYREVLARPRLRLDPARVREVLLAFEMDGLSIEPAGDRIVLPDPDDEEFLAVALNAGAEFLVTGNLADFLKPRWNDCQIVSPAEFLGIWRAQK